MQPVVAEDTSRRHLASTPYCGAPGGSCQARCRRASSAKFSGEVLGKRAAGDHQRAAIRLAGTEPGR